MKYFLDIILLILILTQISHSSPDDSLKVTGREKFQLVFNPPITRWDIPIGNYNNIARPISGFGALEIKYLSPWNIGIGAKSGFIMGTIDEDKFMNYYEEEWFSTQSDLLNEKRVIYIDTGWNFFTNFFLCYSYIYSKKIDISFKIGYMFLEVDDLLYRGEHELFYAGYLGNNVDERYTVYCQYNNSPFLAPNVGFSVSYKLNKVLSLNLDIEYIRVETEIEAYVESDVPHESYPKTFIYRPELSILSVGIGGNFWFGK